MQTADLAALITQQRGDSPTLQATNEGRFGAGSFTVISLADYAAQPLPTNLNIRAAFDTIMDTAVREVPGGLPRFVELRMDGDRVIGKVPNGPPRQIGPRFFQPTTSFDANSGIRVAAPDTAPEGPPLPPSFRAEGLEFHRFFAHGGGIGVWFVLLSGILIWVMLITGLKTYFKLLAARRRIQRRELFYKAGGWWRSLHRSVSLCAALLLILTAFSGTWMALESVWHSFQFVPDTNTEAPLSKVQVEQMATTTLRAFKAQHPQTPIKVIRLRSYNGVPQGVIVSGGNATTQYVYHARTGILQSLSEPGYPKSRFPFGDQLHQSMKRFHSGSDYGIAGRLINLLAGISLVYLSVSGLVLYWTMWRKRRKTGRKALFWA